MSVEKPEPRSLVKLEPIGALNVAILFEYGQGDLRKLTVNLPLSPDTVLPFSLTYLV